ncbi:MAG: hypothetical protein MK135_14890 [Polyangiaceae bacterium]|nr:hypothetical protein [Polyangiaceae bacterium]
MDGAAAEDAPMPREVKSALERWHRAGPWRRLQIVLIVCLIVVHLSVMLLWGVKGVREKGAAGPAFFWYAQGFGLASSWGMFARPGDMKPTKVVVVDGNQVTRVVRPPEQFSFWQQVINVRDRKLRVNLTRPGVSEQFLSNYLQSYCAKAGEKVQIYRLVHAPGAKFSWTDEVLLRSISCPADSTSAEEE